MKTGFKMVLALVVAVASLAAQAQGQSTYSVKLPPGVKVGDLTTKSAAGATFGSPLGFGASWGEAGVGFYSQTFEGASDDVDGAVGVAVGLGDAKKALGLELGLAFSSLWGGANGGGSFGDNGSLSAKLHSRLTNSTSFAVGVTGLARFGDQNDVTESSIYAVGSQFFKVDRYLVVANLGAGNNFFNQGEGGVNPFGSLAFYFNPQVSLIADYNGNVLNAGVSVAPLKRYPLTVTLGAINTTGRYGGSAEFGAMASYGFRF